MRRVIAFLLLCLTVLSPRWVSAQDHQYPPPDLAEITANIEKNWADWSWRFARFANREGEPAQLVAVEGVHCGWTDGRHMDCEVKIRGQFDDGVVRTVELPTMFDLAPDHRLQQVILLSHSRRKILELEPFENLAIEPTIDPQVE